MTTGTLDASDPVPPLGFVQHPRAGSDASSAPNDPPPPPAQGALPLLTICPNCLLEVDEDLYCSGCGKTVIDRGSHQPSKDQVRAAEGDKL